MLTYVLFSLSVALIIALVVLTVLMIRIKRKPLFVTGCQRTVLTQYARWYLAAMVKAEENGIKPEIPDKASLEDKRLFHERDKTQTAVRAIAEILDMDIEIIRKDNPQLCFVRKNEICLTVSLREEKPEVKPRR